LKLHKKEIEKIRKRRFFTLWLAEFDKNQKESGAEALMKFSMLHQVMRKWKEYSDNQKKMRVFKTYNYEARLMQHALELLKGNNVVN